MTNRHWKISPAQVEAANRKAAQAAAMRAYVQECAERAMTVFRTYAEAAVSQESAAVEMERAIATWNAVVANEQTMVPMPVPVHIAPVKRWAGGKPEADAWFWDWASF